LELLGRRGLKTKAQSNEVAANAKLHQSASDRQQQQQQRQRRHKAINQQNEFYAF